MNELDFHWIKRHCAKGRKVLFTNIFSFSHNVCKKCIFLWASKPRILCWRVKKYMCFLEKRIFLCELWKSLIKKDLLINLTSYFVTLSKISTQKYPHCTIHMTNMAASGSGNGQSNCKENGGYHPLSVLDRNIQSNTCNGWNLSFLV